MRKTGLSKLNFIFFLVLFTSVSVYSEGNITTDANLFEWIEELIFLIQQPETRVRFNKKIIGRDNVKEIIINENILNAENNTFVPTAINIQTPNIAFTVLSYRLTESEEIIKAEDLIILDITKRIIIMENGAFKAIKAYSYIFYEEVTELKKLKLNKRGNNWAQFVSPGEDIKIQTGLTFSENRTSDIVLPDREKAIDQLKSILLQLMN